MGEQISCSFDNIEDELNEMDWDLFPIENQRMILFILAVTDNQSSLWHMETFPLTIWIYNANHTV